MIAQTVLPLKWVIVNDGSTDATEALLNSMLAKYQLDRIGESSGTHGSEILPRKFMHSTPGWRE